MHKDFGRLARGRGPAAYVSWRLRALQLGVSVFALVLLASLVGLMLR